MTGAARGVPDISMSGACNGAVDMYQSFKGQPAGWYPTCGTSEATPLFAGVVALADQVAGHPLGLINPALYQMSAMGKAAGIVDVTKGNNTVSFPPGRQGAHRDRVQRPARVRPRLRGGHGQRGSLRAGTGRIWPADPPAARRRGSRLIFRNDNQPGRSIRRSTRGQARPGRPRVCARDPSGRREAPNTDHEHTGRARIPPWTPAACRGTRRTWAGC